VRGRIRQDRGIDSAVTGEECRTVSAMSSSRLYPCEPNMTASVIPFRFSRDASPELWVSSWKSVAQYASLAC